MKKTALYLILALCAGACGTTSPEQRYLDAIQKKLDGDQRGFYDEMMTLAVEESDSRAGRRARAAVTGGTSPLLLVAIAGFVSAFAIPNFIEHQEKSTQSGAELESLEPSMSEQDSQAAVGGKE